MSTEQPMAEKLPANAEHAAPTPWAEGRRRLEAGGWYWLTTVRPDRRPHVMPVLAVWLEGALYFVAADTSRKAHNLAYDPHCVMTVAVETATRLGFSTLEGGHMRLVATAANRQPAVAAYFRAPDESEYLAFILNVLRIEGGAIAEITGFSTEVFGAFGLPLTL
jgi:hypothetical protein